jgi:hypothetical protein
MIKKKTAIRSLPIRMLLAGILFYFSFLNATATEAQGIASFAGRWSYTSPRTSFLIIITQKESALSGTHCSTMAAGRKIDCYLEATDISITGTVTDANLVTVTFKSFFSETSGKATLKKISPTQIEWTITEAPKGEFYLPSKAVLIKK